MTQDTITNGGSIHGRACAANDKRVCRVPLMLTQREMEAVDEFGWTERIKTRSAALRRLIRDGLEAAKVKSQAAPDARKEGAETTAGQ